jgi:hypothetical protein
MTEDIKKYPVPKEISKLFKRSIGAEKCRDFAIKIGANIKIALAFSEAMTNSTDMAWKKYGLLMMKADMFLSKNKIAIL